VSITLIKSVDHNSLKQLFLETRCTSFYKRVLWIQVLDSILFLEFWTELENNKMGPATELTQQSRKPKSDGDTFPKTLYHKSSETVRLSFTKLLQEKKDETQGEKSHSKTMMIRTPCEVQR
jgi:hypothetical protein